MDTFESVWRLAHLEMPAVPPLLVRAWAQEAYNKAADHWGWSFLRSEAIITTQASRSLTVGVTRGSTIITSAAAFVASDAGRQFRTGATASAGNAQGRLPIYTLVSVTNDSLAVLDLPYGDDDDTSASGSIYDQYFICPSDFRRFLVIYDRYYLRVIPFWMSEDEIAIADPGRVFSDSGPRYLVAQKYSPATATLGRVRYEYWPAPTSARTYPYLYIAAPGALNDGDTLPGVFSTRGDLLRSYVLMKCARWPGTTDLRNPGYDLNAARLLQAEWLDELNRLANVDDNEYPEQYSIVNWTARTGGIAPTATLLRQTDATINDYW